LICQQENPTFPLISWVIQSTGPCLPKRNQVLNLGCHWSMAQLQLWHMKVLLTNVIVCCSHNVCYGYTSE